MASEGEEQAWAWKKQNCHSQGCKIMMAIMTQILRRHGTSHVLRDGEKEASLDLLPPSLVNDRVR